MDNNAQKKCGFCGESIPREASRCPYCGSIVEVSFDETYGSFQQEQPQNSSSEGNADVPPQGIENTDGYTASNVGGNNEQDELIPKDAFRQQYGYNVQPKHYGQQQQHAQRQYYPRNDHNEPPQYGKPPLGNGLKVFLTMLFTLLPGLGQLAGIITAIVFMSTSGNTDGDKDRKSFGVALLVACLVMFAVTCISCFLLSLLGQQMNTIDRFDYYY